MLINPRVLKNPSVALTWKFGYHLVQRSFVCCGVVSFVSQWKKHGFVNFISDSP